MSKVLNLFFVFSVLSGLCGCRTENKTEASPEYNRGKTVYQTHCTACHNSDPKKPGSLGPEVFGSSKELLSARILKGEYPPQYKPKRETHVMTPLPHLKEEINALHNYLNQ